MQEVQYQICQALLHQSESFPKNSGIILRLLQEINPYDISKHFWIHWKRSSVSCCKAANFFFFRFLPKIFPKAKFAHHYLFFHSKLLGKVASNSWERWRRRTPKERSRSYAPLAKRPSTSWSSSWWSSLPASSWSWS